METLEFLMNRVAFMGLPFAEVQSVARRVQARSSWKESFLRLAQQMRFLAEVAEADDRDLSATEAWKWTACAYHAATFDLHLRPNEYSSCEEILRLRMIARQAYRRGIHNDYRFIRPVEIPTSTGCIHGYLRTPLIPVRPARIVVLLNGLDSLCEVELHSFGDWLLSRNLAVLALDLPASLSTRPRQPTFAIENLAAAIADWITQLPHYADSGHGAFGVSFGGHLVARLLAGDKRFTCGVAVSPPAWMSAKELRLKRVRLMFACAFNRYEEWEIDDLAARIHLDQLVRPTGRLLIFQMKNDQLFGPEHTDAFCNWAGPTAEVRRIDAEHVGTSRFHYWLPEACDWLSKQLLRKDHGHEEIRDTGAYSAVC